MWVQSNQTRARARMVQESGSGQTALLPHWATFWGVFGCIAATLVALMAVTARGTQTIGATEEQETRKRCSSIRALCGFMCARRSSMVWWKALILRLCLVGSASILSSALSLLITNITANESEPIRDTIRIIVKEMLGIEGDAKRRKREADCFDTNDSYTRCPTEIKMATQVCEFNNFLEAHLDSPMPPTCTIMVAILLFATLSALALSVTTATTIVCHKLSDRMARTRRHLQQSFQPATQTTATNTENANTATSITENAATEDAITEHADTEDAITEHADTEDASTEKADTENANTEKADSEAVLTEDVITEYVIVEAVPAGEAIGERPVIRNAVSDEEIPVGGLAA